MAHAVRIAPAICKHRLFHVHWSLETARAARDVASNEASNCKLHARVTGHTTKRIRKIGGASVRLEFVGAPLQPGGWVAGLGASFNQNGKAFLPTIGGAPGGDRRGLFEAMVLARPAVLNADTPSVTFLEHESLEQWLPVGAEIEVAPIWQCLDFFNLESLFDMFDNDSNGVIDKQELRKLLNCSTGRLPSENEVEEIMRLADLDGDGLIGFHEFAESAGFADTKLQLQLQELAARAATLVQALHQRAPWHGTMMHVGQGHEALLAGTGLAIH
jgi:hypothetical protein